MRDAYHGIKKQKCERSFHDLVPEPNSDLKLKLPRPYSMVSEKNDLASLQKKRHGVCRAVS